MHATSDHVGFEQRAVIGLQTLTRTRRATGPPFSSVFLTTDRDHRLSIPPFPFPSYSLPSLLNLLNHARAFSSLLALSRAMCRRSTVMVSQTFSPSVRVTRSNQPYRIANAAKSSCSLGLGCVWLFFTQIRDVKHVLREHKCLKMQAT